MNNAEAVREFTVGTGHVVPDVPRPMSVEEVNFTAKMMLDEIMELMATVHTSEKAKSLLKTFVDDSEDLDKLDLDPNDDAQRFELIAEQGDALIDSYYYSLNSACKAGINLSAMFDVVHGANMAKRDPVTKIFTKRESDGKIIKPAGWTPPDVKAEIARQAAQGSWSKSR